MMKKNFLGKFMVLAAMIYAGFTLSSCDEKDNPSGNNWTELKVTNKTATSATVTANSASEVNSLIASLSKDIKAAVTDGKDTRLPSMCPHSKLQKPTTPSAFLHQLAVKMAVHSSCTLKTASQRMVRLCW